LIEIRPGFDRVRGTKVEIQDQVRALIQDLRYSFQSLTHKPLFACGATLMLASDRLRLSSHPLMHYCFALWTSASLLLPWCLGLSDSTQLSRLTPHTQTREIDVRTALGAIEVACCDGSCGALSG
jgi:hypothetical protein